MEQPQIGPYSQTEVGAGGRQDAAKTFEQTSVIHWLLESAPLVVSVKDEQWRHIYMNPAMERAIGRRDWYGKTTAEIFPPALAAAITDNDRAVLEADQMMLFVQDLPGGPDGISRKLVAKWAAVGPTGRRVIVTLALDAGEVGAAQSAAALTRFAGAVLDAISSNVAVIDTTGTILAVNAAWSRFAIENGGDPRATGRGANYLAVCDAAAAAGDAVAGEFAAGIRAVIDGRRDFFEMEYPCHSPTEKRWFAGRVTRLSGERPGRVVVVHENITARKAAEMERAERARVENERNRLRGSVEAMKHVLGVVAHELRTPLAGILSIAELLNMSEMRQLPEREQYIEALPREVRRMSDIVNNLLEAARLNAGAARWNWQSLRYGEICEEAIDTVGPVAAEHGVELTWRTEPADLSGTGDADAVRRLMVNLLSNACRHTPSGGKVELSCRAAEHDGGAAVEITVADTGEGIDLERSGNLGEPFACSSGALGARHVRGSGLGLAICRGIAGAHGGRITIESAPHMGTTVTAVLRRDLPGPQSGAAELVFVKRRAA